MKKSFNIELPQDFDEYGVLQCWYFAPILLTPTQENVVRELVGKIRAKSSIPGQMRRLAKSSFILLIPSPIFPLSIPVTEFDFGGILFWP